MAFAVVTSLLEIVDQRLQQPNPFLIPYDKEIIVSLSHKLRFLQAFLEESGKKTKDPRVKGTLEAKIRDVAVEAEGKIESELREIYLAANRGDCVDEACQGLHQTLEQIVKDIERVQTGIEWKVSTDSHVGSSPNDFKEENAIVRGASENAVEAENEIIVGFTEDIVELVDRLKSKKDEVISLVGEGGIGKTTLAKIIFEHENIIAHFGIRASVVVSQEPNIKEMLIGLLRYIVPMTSEISNKDETQLRDELHKRLMEHKYLIVLDDVWTTSAWHAIEGCIPPNKDDGSKIMITTRIYEVARSVSERPHNMKSQTPDKSWELFSRKVFREGCLCTPKLEKLGREIVNCCGGLPLAILVIAGLLSTVKGSLEIWTDVLEALSGMDADNRISKILSLGFDYLPSHLKACFLYFGVFPEDSDILIKKIINLWVAEGFLKPEKNKSSEEGAENCLLDLINRNLVQFSELSIDGKIKSCKIHDRLHEICVREAKRENIICLLHEKHAPKDVRWVSCQSSGWPFTPENYKTHTSKEIHSIFYFGKELYLSKCRLVFPDLVLLRVLDLSLIKCLHGMPNGIVDLIHLRYLALSTIGSFYKFQLLKLKNLQTLIVSSWMEEYPLQVQYDILDLPQLRHLRLQKRCSQYLPSETRKNLQTLYWLKVTSSDRNPNFGMVPNLKELGIYIEGELVSGCLENLVDLDLLEKLKFRIGRVERFCLPTSFPSKLKKLTLCSTYLPWDEMGVIGKLSNLEVLKLKDFAFCGPQWEPIEGEFKRLKVLLIARSDLKRWEPNVHHFPILERLILRYCWDLKEVPNCFARIGTMKLIVLDSCTSSLVGFTKKWLEGMADCPLRFRQVGIKVELPDNESFEEVTVESSEEESVESSKEESVKSSKEESLKSSKEESVKSSKEESVKSSKEESVGSSKEECMGSWMVELPNNESSEELSVESSKIESVGRYKELSVGSSDELSVGSFDQERLKARKSVRKYLKKKVSKSLNAFKELMRKVL
ncbi:PREDICTED: putative late blight resistance protein homolog R1B-14 isoform X2 [Ipomoea nil]|uniref:putative late blight resistance protein homolog R1B-14 isoform X2 n=1 Tax=Ipomoea nil TaxID=35883 RepID=UPI0009011255|nr:PREDICTED: putative late blight resistance protein homolog R1B-14 isoform X2 [Ipomoea nil]